MQSSIQIITIKPTPTFLQVGRHVIKWVGKYKYIKLSNITVNITRLANVNRSHVSIPLKKILARAGGVVDQVQIFLQYSLMTMQNVVTVSHIVCTHVKVPRNFWHAGTLCP